MIILPDPIYGACYAISTCPASGLVKELTKSKMFSQESITTAVEMAEHSMGFCMEGEETLAAVIWVAPVGTLEMRRVVALHECIHAATLTFEGVGIPLTMETTEAFAYYLTWLTAHVHLFLKLKRHPCPSRSRKTSSSSSLPSAKAAPSTTLPSPSSAGDVITSHSNPSPMD